MQGGPGEDGWKQIAGACRAPRPCLGLSRNIFSQQCCSLALIDSVLEGYALLDLDRLQCASSRKHRFVALAFMLATIDTAFTSPLRVIRSDVSQINLEAR
jgi:hypothetical protein